MVDLRSARIRRLRSGLSCMVLNSAVNGRNFGTLEVRLLAAKCKMASHPGGPDRSGRQPSRPGIQLNLIKIRFPRQWPGAHGSNGSRSITRRLSHFSVREPLIGDLAALVMDPGHSRRLIENTMVALVIMILDLELAMAS